MDLVYLLVAAMVASLVLFQLNQRHASPVIAIFNRWLRWLIFAIGGAKLCLDLEWSMRPLWVVAVALFLIYFLVETMFRWLQIHALSVSPLPLFPRFNANLSGEEWPTNPRFLRLRDWLRAHGFRQVQALKAEVGGGMYLRVSVYQDAAAETRLQVTFLPQTSGSISVCFTLTTQTVSGYRYVTDNLYLPFGGFYPENWLVERKPWRRGLSSLLARHQARIRRNHEIPQPWTDDPVVDLNAQQRELEQVNTELGFLFPRSERDHHGKMTYEGRYRVWKEIWLLNYLGLSVRYS